MCLFNKKQKREIQRLEPTLAELGYTKRINKSFGYRIEATLSGHIELSIYINKERTNISWSIEDMTMLIEPSKIEETANSMIMLANNNIYLSGSTAEYGLNYIDFTMDTSRLNEMGIKEIHEFFIQLHEVYKPLIKKAKPGELPFN